MEGPLQILVVVLIVGLCDLSTQQRTAPGVPPQHYDPNMGHQFQQPPQHFQQGQVPMHQGQVQGQIPIQNMHGHGQAHPHGQVPIQQHQQGQVPIQQHQQGQVPIQHHQQGQVPVQHQQGQVPMQQVQQVQVPVQHHGQAPGQPAQLPGQAHPGGHHGGGHGHHAPHGQLLDASNVAQERQHIQEHMDVPIDTSQMSEQELQFHYFKMHDSDNNNKLDGCELVKSLIHWHDHEEEGESNALDDNQISNVVDQVLDYDVNRDGMIDYPEFVTAQNLAQKKEEKKKCATCRD